LLYQDKKRTNRRFFVLKADILESASQIEKLPRAIRDYDCYLPFWGRKVSALREFRKRA
jgi:hypothetical protein